MCVTRRCCWSLFGSGSRRGRRGDGGSSGGGDPRAAQSAAPRAGDAYIHRAPSPSTRFRGSHGQHRGARWGSKVRQGESANLGVATTAEGVETREELEQVRAEGCTEIQGFYICKPAPAHVISRIFLDQSRKSASAAWPCRSPSERIASVAVRVSGSSKAAGSSSPMVPSALSAQSATSPERARACRFLLPLSFPSDSRWSIVMVARVTWQRSFGARAICWESSSHLARAIARLCRRCLQGGLDDRAAVRCRAAAAWARRAGRCAHPFRAAGRDEYRARSGTHRSNGNRQHPVRVYTSTRRSPGRGALLTVARGDQSRATSVRLLTERCENYFRCRTTEPSTTVGGLTPRSDAFFPIHSFAMW